MKKTFARIASSFATCTSWHAFLSLLLVGFGPAPTWSMAEGVPMSVTQDLEFTKNPPLELHPRRIGNLRNGGRLLEEQVEDAVCDLACCEREHGISCASTSEDNGSLFATTPIAIQVILIVLLISMSAFFSGLTLGLMGLDKTGLEIVMSKDDKYATYAKRIYPIRERGNLLLCTLLLGNVCVNSFLSILTADLFGGAVALVGSTFMIVIFGEIVPQSLCQRYSLEVGSASVPVVRVIIWILYPIAFPLSYALDKALGEELATTYSSQEMQHMLQIHVQENVIDPDTAVAMTGALKYKTKLVKEVMTPLENTFMLSADEKLNFETIAKIFKTGYSRIPVYKVNKNNVIGLLFTKDLIFIDPEDETRVADFVDLFGRGLHVVWPDDLLGDVLRDLKQGKSHMALVRDVNNEDESADPFYEVKGIITLEDIIEEIIGDEIVDETDAFVDGTHKVKVDRRETFTWASLSLLDAKIVDEYLSFDESKAVTAHLSKNYERIFKMISEPQLQHLISNTPVSVLPTAEHEIGHDLPRDLLYERGTPIDFATLVLSGRITVIAGQDNFRTDVSSWSVLGANSLIDGMYKPDFTAFISSGPCRCLHIPRSRFTDAMDASMLQRRGQSGPSPVPPNRTPNSSVKQDSTPILNPRASKSKKSERLQESAQPTVSRATLARASSAPATNGRPDRMSLARMASEVSLNVNGDAGDETNTESSNRKMKMMTALKAFGNDGDSPFAAHAAKVEGSRRKLELHKKEREEGDGKPEEDDTIEISFVAEETETSG